MEYCEVVEEVGISNFYWVFVLNIYLIFINDLVDLVMEILDVLSYGFFDVI